jgi:hypothetical protein
MHTQVNLLIHLNTVAKRRKMSSEHRRNPWQEGEEGKEEEAKEEESKEEETKEEEEDRLDGIYDECAGSFPDLVYPPPPVLEEEVPDDLPI